MDTGDGGEAYTILSCTSQDSESHPATAVKSPTATTYWQTQAPEKKAALELALATPVQIQRIVIGNAGAAFVEILVGKSTSRPIDYQVLQPIKPLCTMSESKSGANRYSGYSFADKFERNVAKQTWDRVKPWNVGPLGLSFVIINPTTDVSHLLKPSVGLSAPPKPTTATTTPSTTTSASSSKPTSAATKIAPPLPKPTSNEKAKEEKKADESVPLNKLLAGVTFVISGIQNPQRADIRDKATKMGAKYQQNWDNRATHLICAFQDTPKYREVKGKGGIIVKPEWIVHSFAQKKRLPLTKYTFEKVKEDEEEEVEKQGHTAGGGAPMEEEEEEGLLDRRKAKNRPPAPEAKEDDSDTEEMDELDLGPTLPIALPTEAEHEGGDDDDDMLPTLPIARDYDDDVPTYKAKVDKGKGKGKGKGDAEEEEEGTEEIDELDLLPTLPIFEYQQAKQTKGPPKAKSESDTADSANKRQERKSDPEDKNEEEEEDEGYDLPTLAMDHAYSAKKSEARRVEGDEEGDTEEMEEEGDDLNATLPIPEYAEPTKKLEKPTPPAASATAATKQAGKEEDEDSGTEEMDEVDLLPTLPIVAATTMMEAKSSSWSVGKRKREVSKEEESSGTEPLSDVDAPPFTEDKLLAKKGAAAAATTKASQPLAKKQKPEPTTAKAKDSEVLGKLFAVRPLPDFLDGVNVFFHGKSFDDDMRRLLQRYIVAYKGRVSPYLYEDVTHVVTTDDWGKDFERALKEHPGLVIARPEWVLECHIQQKRVNTAAYRLSP
ncbi:BRCA1 C Terminus (BRCT) domain containing protein [Acanthamoeba castellanii str. Neff]|uniref:BRCA1 C Terminus (BRCT) domain containing protein n=1 Tax=Acanthamoeba castellanii (strain ATCC 30010 / Neff) TaxID=1257118 RepID=L8GH74_ACACF|nr:BRCA1 C Terminus (BRCT) domain containing protein [Acanthamoeba castellanii str. Neff]ELR12347.1 BRCA1 C Terminus (BRCT) domain containing protein [Acanthamoeba castellanii str. Neff]